jgi:hypothetical protein
VYELGYERTTVSFVYASAYASGDIGYLESLYTIVYYIGDQFHIVYIEGSQCIAFRQHGAYNVYLGFIEVFAYFFYHPNIAEELCT